MEEPLKIAGTENPTDIGTQGRANLEDIDAPLSGSWGQTSSVTKENSGS